MQDELKETITEQVSVENLFLAGQESYEEAQRRSAEENKSFSKTEFFRMDKLGTYNLRLLPIAPSSDGTLDRKSYEYPCRSLLLELINPKSKSAGKSTSAYVSVPRATDAGFTVDLIDTYRKEAVDEALSRGNEKMAEKISGGSFGGGLKFNYSHAIYILNLDERAKGIQFLNLSHSQFKTLEEKRFDIWQKLLQKSPKAPCPISSLYDGYGVEIKKKKNGSKTEYDISLDTFSGPISLAIEELNALLAAPRIPEVINRYSRYHYEATVEYLKQCDERFEMEIMETEAVKTAIEQLGAEIPKEDTSSFSFDKRTKDSKDNTVDLSYDDLCSRFDELQEAGKGDKSEEGQELRAMIRTFIEQEKLDVRVTRMTKNGDLLDLIDDVYADKPKEEEKDEAPEDLPIDEPEEDVDTETGEITPRNRRR